MRLTPLMMLCFVVVVVVEQFMQHVRVVPLSPKLVRREEAQLVERRHCEER